MFSIDIVCKFLMNIKFAFVCKYKSFFGSNLHIILKINNKNMKRLTISIRKRKGNSLQSEVKCGSNRVELLIVLQCKRSNFELIPST